jgi:Uma2 family endonuclease
MSVVARPLTYEDLCRAREDGNRYELIEGELILVAAPSPWHQRLSRRLVVLFDRIVGETGIGEVFDAPLDVRFADGSVVQPDVFVVLADRAHIVEETLIEGAPSLLVEISSPSSRAIDRRRKAALYARNGIPEYWCVDPDDRAIIVHADPAEGAYQTVRRETAVARSVTVPGLVVNLAELFSGLPARP